MAGTITFKQSPNQGLIVARFERGRTRGTPDGSGVFRLFVRLKSRLRAPMFVSLKSPLVDRGVLIRNSRLWALVFVLLKSRLGPPFVVEFTPAGPCAFS